MVATIFQVIADSITQFTTALVSGVNGMLPLIYDNANGGSLTFVGTMLLIAVGIGVVYWIFRLLRGITAGVAR